MFNDEFKVVFIHFPKTGGSSIEDYFGSGDGYRESIFTGKDGKVKKIREQHHTSYDDFILKNGSDVIEECFTFSFIRNPWDWFVSNFFWDIKVYWENEKIGHPQKIRRKFIVEECNSNFQTYVSKGMERPDWFKFRSMKSFCGNVEFIGRFENLQKDFDFICDKINAPKRKLGHLKKPDPRPHYSAFYNEKCIEHVYNLMKTDIDEFQYKFEKKDAI